MSAALPLACAGSFIAGMLAHAVLCFLMIRPTAKEMAEIQDSLEDGAAR